MRLLLITLLTFYNFYLLSQSIELKNEYKQTNKYFKDKNFNQAFLSNERALALSVKEFGLNHLTTATLLENKEDCFWNLKNINKQKFSLEM